jgi:hypothetical protein
MAQRVGRDDCLKNLKAHQLDFYSAFNLAQRTAQAWRNGQAISKVSFDIQTNVYPLMGTPLIRIF